MKYGKLLGDICHCCNTILNLVVSWDYSNLIHFVLCDEDDNGLLDSFHYSILSYCSVSGVIFNVITMKFCHALPCDGAFPFVSTHL